jgi:hypothetical protein
MGDCLRSLCDPGNTYNATQGEVQWYENNSKAFNLITIALCRNIHDHVSHLKTALNV